MRPGRRIPRKRFVVYRPKPWCAAGESGEIQECSRNVRRSMGVQMRKIECRVPRETGATWFRGRHGQAANSGKGDICTTIFIHCAGLDPRVTLPRYSMAVRRPSHSYKQENIRHGYGTYSSKCTSNTTASVEHAVITWAPLISAPCARHTMGDTCPREFITVCLAVPR